MESLLLPWVPVTVDISHFDLRIYGPPFSSDKLVATEVLSCHSTSYLCNPTNEFAVIDIVTREKLIRITEIILKNCPIYQPGYRIIRFRQNNQSARLALPLLVILKYLRMD